MVNRSPGALAGHDWAAEYERLTAEDLAAPLPPDSLERLAVAAFLLGRDEETFRLRDRAFEAYVAAGRRVEAVRCAFWTGFHRVNRGEFALAAGLRARVALEFGTEMAADAGLAALFLDADAAPLMMAGDATGALALFERAARLAEAAGDIDAYVLARLGSGRCLAIRADPTAAVAVMDEVMAHVSAGACAPQVMGLAYCGMIELCMRRFDLRRARQWTEALGSWCDDQSGMVPYRGSCQVHRATIAQLRGFWTEALSRASSVTDDALDEPGVVGGAYYRMAEIARLRGHVEVAEELYGQAVRCGVDPQPGLGLLRAAQGNRHAARVGLDRALAEDVETSRRPALQSARLEIALADGDLALAREAADDLGRLAAEADVPYLNALAAHAAGAVLLAGGRARDAIPELRRASALWRQEQAPYEGAHTRVLLGAACAALGDEDGARMETAAAAAVFERLGAVVDVAALDAAPVSPAGGSSRNGDRAAGHSLTARELEVLRLVATGATNRQIADALVLSEKTVARHLANIFGKLGVSTRAAATAYAFRHRMA